MTDGTAQESETLSEAPGEQPVHGRSSSVLRWGLFAAGCLAAVWAFLQGAYFLRSNVALFFDGPGGPLGVFSGLVSDDWSFSLRHCPPLALLAALFVAGITTLLGFRVQVLLGVRLPMRLAICTGFVLGLGVSGIAFELLTMARLLYLPLAWLVWIALFAGTEWGIRRLGRSGRWRDLPFLFGVEPVPEKDPVEERVFWWAGGVLVLLITLAIFWHALLFPETYWDSLILYLGYGRMTFLEHGFPFKAVGQVGIGLGANYPHLFSTYGAVAGTMFGHWSDVAQRFAAPLAGLLTTILIYDACRLAGMRAAFAMAGALAWRLVPYGVAYSTYASDYAIAILLVAAFLALAVAFARRPHWGLFALLTFLPAIGMHINYLMGILWGPWIVAVVAALWRRDPSGDSALIPVGPFRLLATRRFWAVFLVCALAASTWNIRNWVLTGNPVYSFFPNLFPASVHINPEVMKSADLEWFRNGDGIGRLAEQFEDIEKGRPSRDHGDPAFQREANLGDRLRASFLFWQGFETFRVTDDQQLQRGRWLDRLKFLFSLRTTLFPGEPEQIESPGGNEVRLLYSRHAYKMAPVMLGFAIPGLLLFLAALVARRFTRPADRTTRVELRPLVAGAAVAFTLLGGLLAYHYLLADYYLYQIIPILPAVAFFAAAVWLPFAERRLLPERFLSSFLFLLILVAGFVPGLAMALLNFKVTSGGRVYGQEFIPLRMDVFRHPGLETDAFYRLQYQEMADAWQAVNELAAGTPLLTHDNRHLMYDPSIELVHLDDWDVQQIYGKPAQERLAFFRERGIVYYLRIPNEAKHTVNRRAGLDELIERGDLVLLERFGPNELYQFAYSR
ncbi:MAG: hypothetical protein PWP23_680 [Candidatus Sumerlaeota bacterium]|nr:hypothetical protein [Candidatus Sumerlaeota bacterium]